MPTDNIPGDPRKYDEFVFLHNFKSSKDRTKLLDGKEAEFYKIFSDTNYLKIQPLVTTPISKSGQNAEKSGMWLFFKLFSVLTI